MGRIEPFTTQARAAMAAESRAEWARAARHWLIAWWNTSHRDHAALRSYAVDRYNTACAQQPVTRRVRPH